MIKGDGQILDPPTEEELKNALFTIKILANGNFAVIDEKTQKPLEEIPEEVFYEELFTKPVNLKESIVSPFLTFFKQNSGLISACGRKFRVPR